MSPEEETISGCGTSGTWAPPQEPDRAGFWGLGAAAGRGGILGTLWAHTGAEREAGAVEQDSEFRAGNWDVGARAGNRGGNMESRRELEGERAVF